MTDWKFMVLLIHFINEDQMQIKWRSRIFRIHFKNLLSIRGGWFQFTYWAYSQIKSMGGRDILYIICKTSKHRALACKTYLVRIVTYLWGFALWSHKFSLLVITVRTYFKIISTSEPQTQIAQPYDPFQDVLYYHFLNCYT